MDYAHLMVYPSITFVSCCVLFVLKSESDHVSVGNISPVLCCWDRDSSVEWCWPTE